ncbi:fimbrial protein [Chromobacterium haemolyticum]|uniref:fimbrial protein n=1 Tax=Chromobacterium haemolyticum TaxID=394935 RepID=UPI00307F377A
MKKFVFAGSLMAVAASSIFAAAGTLDVKGEIVTAACGLDSKSVNLEVGLGKVPTHVFKKVGDRSAPTPFKMTLTDCTTTTLKTVAVMFSGTAGANNELMALKSGGAKGVGVRLVNTNNGDQIKLNQYGTAVNLVDGNNTLNFSAAYEADGAKAGDAVTVTPGQADAFAVFDLQYK